MATKTKQPPKKQEAVKIVKYSTSLKVMLTTDEIADRADRAAQMLAERDAKEEELKAAQKHAKSVIDQLEAELRRLSNEVRTRSTYRIVECEERYIYDTGTFQAVRLDTAEVILERGLTEAEKQRDLEFPSDD